jgi:hypothetical protein
MGKINLLWVLGILLIVLKLQGIIAWSWLWVLAPFWVGAVAGIIVLGLFLFGLAGGIGLAAWLSRK